LHERIDKKAWIICRLVNFLAMLSEDVCAMGHLQASEEGIAT
jgi:hypothetical protein